MHDVTCCRVFGVRHVRAHAQLLRFRFLRFCFCHLRFCFRRFSVTCGSGVLGFVFVVFLVLVGFVFVVFLVLVVFLSLAVLRFCFRLRCRFLFAVQVVLRIGSQSVAPDGLQRHSPRGSPLFEKCWCPLGSPASPRSDQLYRRWLVKLACALPRVEKEYVPSFGSAARARQCKSMPSRS